MAKVVVKNLVKKFKETIAVNNVSFTVKDKRFLVLLGPSGCGKTTTLRCISGLETADEGEIYIGDRLVNHLAPRDRDVALVFQSYALYPHMKVFDNLGFPLKMHKVPKDERKKRVKQTAELLRITHLLNRKPKQLSGGEAQRTALGRAIVRNPKVFLMDEPLSNLDAKLRVYMRVELKRLQKELGVTTIYVTHDQVEAMTMADEVAIMNEGALEQIDKPISIYEKPATKFVAGFIGSPPMNLIDCSLVEKEGSAFLDTGPFTLPMSSGMKDLIKMKDIRSELMLGVRPEHISLSWKRMPESLSQAEVYAMEPLGCETIVDIKIGESLFKARLEYTHPCIKVIPGEKVWMAINEENIHLFDKKNGKALF